MKRFFLLVLLLVMSVALLFAEGKKEEKSYPEPAIKTGVMGTNSDLSITQDEIESARNRLDEQGTFVGVIAATYSTEYHSLVAESAEAYAKELDLPVKTFDSELDVNKQINAIENFTTSGAELIVICLFDPPSVQSALQEASSKGVMIVQYAGRDVEEFGGVSISIEDADLGQAAGSYAGEIINEQFGGEAQVAILDYPDIPNVVIRAENIRSALLEEAPNAEIVGNYLGGTQENGLKNMESALQEHPSIDVVASINDAGALGAMKALQNAGRTAEDTAIVGIDAEKQAVEYIERGTMYQGTVSTSPRETGKMTIRAAVKMLAGSKLPQSIKVPITVIK